MSKIHTIADVPDELAHDWLQHLRDFDTAHPGCHFEVVVEGVTTTIGDIFKTLDVDPPLDLKFFQRKP